MRKIIDRIAYSFIAIIFLAVIEGMLTMGVAFEFETYSWFAWVYQGMIVFVVVWLVNTLTDKGH